MTLSVRAATKDDLNLIFRFICDLAEYERLRHEVYADVATLGQYLFGQRPMAEVIIGEINGEPKGFALFFHNFSTFEGKPGLYLEDLFVDPEARGSGLGKALLSRLARIALDRGCARFEWAVLGGKLAERWVMGGSFQGSLGAVGLRGEAHLGVPDATGNGHDHADAPLHSLAKVAALQREALR